MDTIFSKTFLYCSLCVVFFACSSEKKEEPVPPISEFTEYIEAYSSGSLSNQSDFELRLRKSVDDLDKAKKLGSKLFDFSPKLSGTVIWKDSRTVVFEPDEVLKSGESYKVQFHLGKLFNVSSNLKIFSFSCAIKYQFITVETDALESYSDHDFSKQKLSGVLLTSDFAESSKVEELFKATQDNKKLPVVWDHGAQGKKHLFTIENLIRRQSASVVKIRWDGKSINANVKGEKNVTIPAISDFKVFSVTRHEDKDQSFVIHFSDPIDTNQDLEGLIHLSNSVPLRFSIDGNHVTATPQTPLSQTVTLTVEESVRNSMGISMKESEEQSVVFSTSKPAIELLGRGVIVPKESGVHFPFKAVNLSGVNVKIIQVFQENVFQFLQENQLSGSDDLNYVGRVVYQSAIELTSEKAIDFGQWNNFSLDLSKFIETEPGAIYHIKLSFDKSQSLYPSESKGIEEVELPPYELTKEEEARFDKPGYYWDNDDSRYDLVNYDWDAIDDPCDHSYYQQSSRWVTRNLLVSNLGIIAKSAENNELLVNVTDLTTALPLNNVKVDVYNFQHQKIGGGKTNSEGLLTLALENKPFLLEATYQKQKGYLRLNDGSSLSLSMFNVGGVKNELGIKGYMYAERGVWRPGDSIFVSFFLEDKQNKIPANHPVVFELFDPNDQYYSKQVSISGVNGLYDFRTKTLEDDITGNWLAKVSVGGVSFTKTIRIETVKPNRLKTDLLFREKLLQPGENSGTLTAKWLHGAKAKGLRSVVEMKLFQGKTVFENYPDYVFDDPSKQFETQEDILFDDKLNGDGEAPIEVNINVENSSPGMLTARFTTRTFEIGGDFSTNSSSVSYSPYSNYVGLKFPKGKGVHGAVFSDEKTMVPIVTVDRFGKPVSREGLKIEVYELDWNWWWENNGYESLGRYVSSNSQSRIKTSSINTVKGEALYALTFDKNTWGRKLILVTDPISGHTAGKIFYTDYKAWWDDESAESPGGAEMLAFSTSKKSYNVGEIAKLSLPQAKEARALVSLESGSKVIGNFWVDVNKVNNKIEFKVTKEMSPNVYIHVSLLQPHNQTTNDLPIRMYGIQSIEVKDMTTHLSPVIKMPDILEPEQEVSITVSEKDGNPMTYTVAVVDEGLLDLTRFKTPDAWQKFYAHEALGVKTWDLYNHVLGAFSGELAGLLAIGGDETLIDGDAKKVNRFVPVVKFLGPYSLNKGSKTHIFTMPNYIGSVRTMVVAGQDGAYGSAEKTTPVKKPLMVLATLPRVVGPSEELILPVTVFAMDEKIDDVEVSIRTNDRFLPLKVKSKVVKFREQGEKTVEFDLTVAELLGSAKVDVDVRCNNEESSYSVEMQVRLPNPSITKIYDTIIEPGETWNQPYESIGVAGTNKGVVEVSSVAPLRLENRLNYLIQYPHGCIEQMTSSVFPQLYLSNFLELSADKKSSIENNISEAIDRLRRFQQFDGGLSNWAGTGEPHEWGTSYAGHFLLEAQQKGYAVSKSLIKKWMQFQKQKANNWLVQNYNDLTSFNSRRNMQSQLIQAYRLYTLALAEQPAMGAMNRMREMKYLSERAKWRLAAAYALAGRVEVALELIKNLSTDVDEYVIHDATFGSSVRDKAMILETLTLLGKREKGKTILDEISQIISSNKWLSTQSTAWSLVAIAQYLGSTEVNKSMSFDFSSPKESIAYNNASSIVKQFDLTIEEQSSGEVSIKNTGESILFAKLQLEGIPTAKKEIAQESNLKLSIQYKNSADEIIQPDVIDQGTDFKAEVTITHIGLRENYEDLALTQVFPSGWEIRNLRFENDLEDSVDEYTEDELEERERTSNEQKYNEFEYQDIRDDRIYTYFSLNRGETIKFTVILNAAYKGVFYLPGTICESMYDGSISANSQGGWIIVK